MQADTVWAQEDVPITVHAFLQNDSESVEPALKRQCSAGDGGRSGYGLNRPCLVFYVRMADHLGKFDVDKAKAFALVPRLHYAALKRGESVVASEHLPPHKRTRSNYRSLVSRVTAADGVTVEASQVVGSKLPGKSFAVIDHSGFVGTEFGACARALALQPDTVLHYAAAMTLEIERALRLCESAVHVGVWGAAVELSSMSAGKA